MGTVGTYAGFEPSSSAPRAITLFDLVRELVDTGASDREVVAAVMDLIETRRVRLVGQIRERDLRPQDGCEGVATHER